MENNKNLTESTDLLAADRPEKGEDVVTQDSMGELMSLKEEKDRCMQNNQSLVHEVKDGMKQKIVKLNAEIEKLQLQEKDGEISFLRQEFTRCTNDATQISNKRRSIDEMQDLLSWSSIPRASVHDLVSDDLASDDSNGLLDNKYKEVLEKKILDLNPCLIHYNSKKQEWGFFQYKSFFYRSFPDFWDAEILCSKYGWLLMSVERGYGGYLFFYNPFNDHTKPFVDIRWRALMHKSMHFFHPPTSPNCFIIGVYTNELGVTRVSILRYGEGKGKNEWKCIYCKNDESEFFVSNSAPVLHHGLLYFVGMRGDVATLDVERCAWSALSVWSDDERCAWPVYPKSFGFRKLRSQIKRHYLLKINGDEDDSLYVVFMIHDSETVNVFRLLEPEMKWERVKDLGDKMLYLSLASSFGEVAKSKNMANTICLPMFDSSGDNLLFYSLKTQRYHSFDGNYSFDNSFGLSRLDYGVAWIKPIPTQQLSINGVWYSDTEDLESSSYGEDDDNEDGES